MKLSQKRECGSCRALNPVNGDCDLYFKTDLISPPGNILKKYGPKEPCYKPLTISDYLLAMEIRS